MSQHTGWSIGRSIMLELGMVMDRLANPDPLPELPEALATLSEGLSEHWQDELTALLGSGRGTFLLPLVLAWVADALFLEDYTEATRRIRRLDLPTVMARMTERADALGVGADADADLEPGLRLAELWNRVARTDYTAEDLPELVSRPIDARHPLTRLPLLLRGGALHDRFWHWLDRFYYQTYAAWRQGREPDMVALEQRGVMLLGAAEACGRPPRIDWLPPSNPLLHFPGLRRAVEQGRVEVFFLVEPQGISNMLLILPGMIVAAFAEPDALHEAFHAHVDALATRLKAVADPTRLQILRLMRHLELDNTQIAALLEIARPTVSIHARQLREAGLIETRRAGRKARHAVKHDAVRALFEDLERFLDLSED